MSFLISNLTWKGFIFLLTWSTFVFEYILLCRYDGSLKEASFSIGLQGMAKEDIERVKQIISQTIQDIIECVLIKSLSIYFILFFLIRTKQRNLCLTCFYLFVNEVRKISACVFWQDRLWGGADRGSASSDRDPDETSVHKLWPVSGLGEFIIYPTAEKKHLDLLLVINFDVSDMLAVFLWKYLFFLLAMLCTKRLV